ncbi:hypothetical protein [Loktanella sp. Alg231-35]|uniref:hypothetical protein n=1 Tax=Loktanella sp. Alg231-35 TaxID=1922220 RepID=UPI000D55C90B|nr:hypothetical protein [Loktanella sp. Alg231-35]
MNENTNEKVVKRWQLLVDRLLERTKSGDLDWEESTRSGEFITTVKNSVIRFAQQRNREDLTLYVFRIENDFGEVVDSFNDENLDADQNGAPYFKKVDPFFHDLRRKVSGADELLDELLKELNDDLFA